MKIKNGFVARDIAGQCVVMALGDASKIFNGIIKLNESGKFIWDMLVLEKTAEEIVDALVEEFDGVSREVAAVDVNDFIEKLMGANILE